MYDYAVRCTLYAMCTVIMSYEAQGLHKAVENHYDYTDYDYEHHCLQGTIVLAS